MIKAVGVVFRLVSKPFHYCGKLSDESYEMEWQEEGHYYKCPNCGSEYRV